MSPVLKTSCSSNVAVAAEGLVYIVGGVNANASTRYEAFSLDFGNDLPNNLSS